MEYFYEWLILLTLQMLALASPGPDFVIAVRNSVTQSRRIGIFTAIGFAAGVGVHVLYCVVGLAAIIAQSVMLFTIIKYIGAAYLVYIGIKALRSQGFHKKLEFEKEKKRTMTASQGFHSGFITNLFNPKATMFFLALFTQFIDPATPASVMVIYGLTLVISTGLWFSFVSLVLTHQSVNAVFMRFTKWIERITGGLLIALGIKLAITR